MKKIDRLISSSPYDESLATTHLLTWESFKDLVCRDQELDNAMKHVLMHCDHGSKETFGVLFPIAPGDFYVKLAVMQQIETTRPASIVLVTHESRIANWNF